jgi:ATP-dependent exoDNAse (exonuclease V) alpha subunit
MNDTNEILEVFKGPITISFPKDYPDNDSPVKLATITQFPFIPSYSMTIDKSQGLTLDKAYIMLDNRLRDNQLYVALSRVRKLDDLLLSRRITREDIHLAPAMNQFNESIKDRIIPVNYMKTIKNTINIHNAKTVNIYNVNPLRIKSFFNIHGGETSTK